jgi:hypothetical protein
MSTPAEIQDLLDHPREALHIELKESVDFKDPLARAKLARHLSALANHGGGYLVVGLTDAGLAAAAPPAGAAAHSRDAMASVIDRYLTPAFQCDAWLATPTGRKQLCAVIRVPSHGATPVCAKANGPEVNGKIEGIHKGQHYIRVPGPKSIAIETPEQWQALIRRCVFSERESLLGSIGHLFRAAPDASPPAGFRTWHEAMRTRFVKELARHPHAWPVSLAANHFQLSYRIVERGGQSVLDSTDLLEAIRTANERVRSVVWTGWSMFYIFTRSEIAPQRLIDRGTGEEVEAIETRLINETNLEATLPDFWRITADGRVTLMRAYREDRSTNPPLAARGLKPGNWLAPRELVRDVFELASHAREFSKAFSHAAAVEFRCSWFGLRARRIGDFNPGVDWGPRTCHTEERTTFAIPSIEEFAADPESVAVELYAPVLRLFDGLELDRAWLVKEKARFRSL